MKEASYEDPTGRIWAVLLPDDRPDSEAFMGVHIGPPPLDMLELPEETAVRLHNQLFARRIFTYKDAQSRRADLFAALQSAYKVDSVKLVELYDKVNNVSNGSGQETVAEENTAATVKVRRRKANGR